MKKKIFTLFYLLLSLSAFAQRMNIPVEDADSRFTLSVQRSSSLAGGSEYYYFYIQNNTSREYELNIQITLELACVGTKTISLRSGVSNVLHLSPNARYNSENQAQFIYFGKKDCAVSLGNNDYTLYKSISYSIGNVHDISKDKEEAIAKKKAQEDRKKADELRVKQQKEEQNSIAKQQAEQQRQQTITSYKTDQSAATQQQPESQRLADQQAQYARNLEAQRQYQAERTESITKGVTDLGNLVGSWIQQNQADKAKKEALEEQRAEEERQRQYALYLKTSSRKNAFAEVPSKDIPLISQEKASSIYYFIYAYSNLDSEYGASAYISNVFEIGRYNDGTRAYTATVKNDIENLSPCAEVLHGYYYTSQQAEQKRQELIAVLQSSGCTVNNIFYKGKASIAKAGSITAEKQESSYGTLITAPAKIDTRPNNGTAPNSQVDKFKESQSKNYGTIIK
ncbi:hypothetical protein [Flavobacterium sp. 1355]|jgi:hypothetical protein|uniref:hypothetical protein n=1 Tax=Flavobacterium sp. 1355 TaxID=2806571 RepID=UPI001AE73CE9|nr:hypothetical protein [Flavobacterium sp. 1355]MBP1225944.1 hypothetical protein [Flavobacterium sp. 1355]